MFPPTAPNQLPAASTLGWRLLTDLDQFLIRDGCLYVPLLLDPDIAAAVPAAAQEGRVICQEGRYFIPSLSLAALLEHYGAVFPEAVASLRSSVLAPILPLLQDQALGGDATLKTLLFEVMPYFLRLRRGPHRETRTARALLAYLAAALAPPPQAAALLARLRQQQADLQKAMAWLQERLATLAVPPLPPGDGPAVAAWFQATLSARLLQESLDRCRQQWQELQELLDLPEPQLVQLLAIAARGELEIDDFGIQRAGKQPGIYWVYKKTGDFVLQDYYGRPYLFPSCRVAVNTAGPFRPVVLDTYKHPLLRRWSARQPICLTEYQPPQEFSAQAVIQALQAGLNALYFGYNSRKRNGYNSLDSFGRHLSVVTFDDLRLPKDDPRILSGALEIKNI